MIDKNKIPLTLAVSDKAILKLRAHYVNSLREHISGGRLPAIIELVNHIRTIDSAITGDRLALNEVSRTIASIFGNRNDIDGWYKEQKYIYESLAESILESEPVQRSES